MRYYDICKVLKMISLPQELSDGHRFGCMAHEHLVPSGQVRKAAEPLEVVFLGEIGSYLATRSVSYVILTCHTLPNDPQQSRVNTIIVSQINFFSS